MRDPQTSAYLKGGMKAVDGWFARCDAEMFVALLAAQNEQDINGSVVEIGVHHGKSFVPLAQSNKGQNCYAIDIFDAQELNIDASGKGDHARFLANLRNHGVAVEGVKVDKRMSTVVKAQDIIDACGKARFFHIDGGHHFSAVYSDMALADAALHESGIIVLDDMFRPEWPEVSMGTFAYLRDHDTGLVPFAIGFNKTYLCRKPMAATYQALLRQNRFLKLYFTRDYQAEGDLILVFQRYMLPEWSMSFRVQHYLATYHPDLWYWVQTKRGKI